MAYFYAEFYLYNRNLCRKDTRIYFGDKKPNSTEGNCVGLFILKNPGSAKPITINKWNEIQIDKDKALPWIANRYKSVIEKLKLRVNNNNFIRVCNLIPICDPDLHQVV